MTEKTYPEFVEEKISRIVEKLKVQREDVVEDYETTFNDPFIQKDGQFKNDEDKHRYASAILWKNWISRPPASNEQVIPVGYDGIRLSKSGNKYTNLFVLSKTNRGISKCRVSLQGDAADQAVNLAYFSLYNVRLGKFADGNDLIGDSRAKFENPKHINITPEEILSKWGATRITIAEAYDNPSKIRSDGYVDSLDWKVIRGIISRKLRNKEDSETQWALYVISDGTEKGDPTISPDGRVILPGMTVWLAPEQQIYEENDQCDFVGPVSINKDSGEPSMRAYMILPVHVRKIGG